MSLSGLEILSCEFIGEAEEWLVLNVVGSWSVTLMVVGRALLAGLDEHEHTSRRCCSALSLRLVSSAMIGARLV